MEQVKLSNVLMCAFELVISRYGDVDTEDGSFATCGTDEIIRLDEAMAHFFDVGSDDLELHYADLILKKSKQLDQNIELIANQAQEIERLKQERNSIAMRERNKHLVQMNLMSEQIKMLREALKLGIKAIPIAGESDLQDEAKFKMMDALSATEHE